MSNLVKGLVLVVVVVGIGFGLVVWKKKVGGAAGESLNSISRQEVELLLADASKSNPMVLKRFSEDPDQKKQWLEGLKQIVAFASQAQKDGLANDPTNKQELENIQKEITAVNYDRDMNKDKGGPMPPFGFISEDMVKDYWAQGTTPPAAKGWFGNMMDRMGLGEPVDTRTHEAEFQDFLDSKIALMKASSPQMADREVTEDEKTQAREIFAKIRIYYAEYKNKLAAGQISKDLADRVTLQVKLQKASFLARLFSETVADKLKVTDEEVDKYIADHKEYDPAEKRKKAEDLLNRAKAGEDFATLANQNSDDPGNKDAKTGELKGGAYTEVPKGQMMPAFEQAALALQEGQIAPQLVETDYGFHIIKLDRKLGKKAGSEAETYDVRHILVSTGVKDDKAQKPGMPPAREVPVKDYVRAKLEDEKEKALIDQIVAANNVSVPEDFTVPEVTDEQMQQMRQKQMQQMQQMQPPPDSPVNTPPAANSKTAKPDPKKPEAKKK